MANNTILGGKEMEGLNVAKLEGFKAIGLEGLYKMAAFNTQLMTDPEFLAAIAEQKTVMSSQETATKTKETKGGNKMENKETKTKSTEGGKAMEQETKTKGTKETKGGSKMERTYKLNSFEKEGYMDGVTYILKHFGRKGVYALEEIGVKVAVVSVKEKGALKDLAYRVAVVAGTEWVKSELDNDLIELAGSAIQAYQVVRAGMDVYKIYKSFNKITMKDVENLDNLIDSLISEEKAYDENDNEEEDI